MTDLIIGFLIEVVRESWFWTRMTFLWAVFLTLVFAVPFALGFLVWLKIASLPPGVQQLWTVAAAVVGACAWWVWLRRVERWLDNTFGEG